MSLTFTSVFWHFASLLNKNVYAIFSLIQLKRRVVCLMRIGWHPTPSLTHSRASHLFPLEILGLRFGSADLCPGHFRRTTYNKSYQIFVKISSIYKYILLLKHTDVSSAEILNPQLVIIKQELTALQSLQNDYYLNMSKLILMMLIHNANSSAHSFMLAKLV